MFKKLKMKMAARRVQKTGARKNSTTRRTNRNTKQTFWGCVWNIICWPFRLIGRIIARIWSWIRNLDLVGLINLALLVAIIVLFSMLIIDIVKCVKKPTVVIADTPAVAVTPTRPQIIVTERAAPASVKPRPTLPLKRDATTRKFVAHTITVTECGKETANAPQKLFGDVIIDRRGAAPVLTDNVQIQGNLYLQHMRKYILPCGTKIDGNLFLRDVDMLQFCGDFTVTGNIYVSPRSSFGPIPRTARIGGQVIL